MNLSEAERILGLKAGASTEEVRKAFARQVMYCHPDHGTAKWPDATGQPLSMSDLKKARDLLLERAGAGAKVCPVCRGTGVQSIGLRRYPCVKGCEPA